MHKFIFILFLTFTAFGSINVSAQEREQDQEINYSVRFGRGKTSTSIARRIELGTSHNYSFAAKKGQTMRVTLTTGNATSFTIFSPTEGILENADGVLRWTGKLPESGEYSILIGTDRSAKYTLEISIK